MRADQYKPEPGTIGEKKQRALANVWDDHGE